MRTHLASLVDDLRAHPRAIAVVAHRGVRSSSTTCAELAHLAGRVSAEIGRRQIKPGERILLWGANSPQWIAAFFGCLLRGVLAVPLDTAGSPAFAARILRDTTPSLIFADPALLATLPPSGIPQLELPTLATHLPAEPDYTLDPAVHEDAPFQIVFTSGTTSEPKGIVHTHRNVLASLTPIEREIAKYRRYGRLVHPLRLLHTLPLSHVFGQFMGLWIPAILTAELHFTDTLEPAATLRTLRRFRLSVLIAVPRVLDLLRAHLTRQFPAIAADLATPAKLSIPQRWWRYRAVHRALGFKFWAVISGGAQVTGDLEQFWRRLGLALIQGYGMTETAALITLNHPFRVGQGTLGELLPGRELRLSDAGEIQVRGPMVSTSTWQHGALQSRTDDWLSTGDLAEQSPAGLRFLGRAGDAIVTSAGLNLHPADLEAALIAQPGIRAAVVVPCTLAQGPEPVAVLLTRLDQPTLQAALQAANRTLAEAQQIRRHLRWPETAFPYTSTGKLLRRHVRDWACTHLQQPAGSPVTTSADPILNLIAEITGEALTSPSRPEEIDTLRLTEDLHLDSLARVQLASLLDQRLGLPIPDDQFAQAQTLGDLRRLLNATEKFHPERSGEPAQSNDLHRLTPQKEAPSFRTKSGISVLSSPTATNPQDHYPHWPWTPPLQVLRTLFLELLLRPLVAVVLAPRVELPRAPIPAAPLLIIANHTTLFDGALILYALPGPLRRHVAAAMSGEMLNDFRHARNQPNPVAKLFAPASYWLLTALFNVFPLPRLRGFRESFAHAGEAMDRGLSVLVFPEGTRAKTAEMLPFRQGIGLLSEETRTPVLPVALIGLDAIRSRRTRWFRSGTLTVRIGDPITLPEDLSPADRTARLEASLRALLSPVSG